MAGPDGARANKAGAADRPDRTCLPYSPV